MTFSRMLSLVRKTKLSDMALLFDIKRYAINDGPGIRITLFFKGCPLNCIWCHNPEGISTEKEKMYTLRKCIGCCTCVKACPNEALKFASEGIVTDPNRCKLCGKCADVCPTKAMEISGTEYSVDYLMNEIEKETLFFDQSDGGVTFCGGEPLMQPELLKRLLILCGQRGIHRVVDTSLFAHPELVMEVALLSELFLVDLKMMDSGKHRYFCGVPNELILSNIRMIAEMGIPFSVRIPLIKGVNADKENITRSAEFLASLPGKRREVALLPYHDIAKNKHFKLGTTYNPDEVPMSTPSDEEIHHIREIFLRHGITATVGG
jgi:pyruvate formate lyase activating enzyme